MSGEDVKAIEKAIKDFEASHNPIVDSFLYNGGTALALAASIGSSIWWGTEFPWVPRVLAAIAAFIIGAERALNFGERWRFHLRRRDKARNLQLRLQVAAAGDEANRSAAIAAIVDELTALSENPDPPAGSGGGTEIGKAGQ